MSVFGRNNLFSIGGSPDSFNKQRKEIALWAILAKETACRVCGFGRNKKSSLPAAGDPAGARTVPSVKKLPCGQF